MSRRRRFGNVRRLPSGRWQARYEPGDGLVHRAPNTFATRTSAERWLAAVQTDLSRGVDVDDIRNDEPIRDYAIWWLAHRPSLKASTQELYAWLLGKYIFPDLGATKLSKLTPSRIRQWHAQLSARAPVTPTRQSYSLVRAILSTAVADGLLARNPCTRQRRRQHHPGDPEHRRGRSRRRRAARPVRRARADRGVERRPLG